MSTHDDKPGTRLHDTLTEHTPAGSKVMSADHYRMTSRLVGFTRDGNAIFYDVMLGISYYPPCWYREYRVVRLGYPWWHWRRWTAHLARWWGKRGRG